MLTAGRPGVEGMAEELLMRLPFGRVRRKDAPLTIPAPILWKFAFSVYFKAASTPPGEAALRSVVVQWLDRNAQLPLREELKELIQTGAVTIAVGPREEWPEPSLEMIRAFQTGEVEERRFLEADHVITILALDLAGHGFSGLWCAVATARALAAASGGVIFDGEVGRLLPEKGYLTPLPPNGQVAVADFITIPSSLDRRGQGWITTSGLRRFQIPELEVRDVPPNLLDDLWVVVNATGQLLLEAVSGKPDTLEETQVKVGPELRVSLSDISRSVGEALAAGAPEGARAWTTIRLEEAEDGFLRLVRPKATRIKHGEWLHSLLSDLTGSPTTLRYIEGGSEAMEIAHRRAMDEMPRIKERFLAGLPVGCVLYVKHGFPHGDGEHEYMWLAVNTWEGAQVRCQLVNTPVSRMDLRAGQPFKLGEEELYDWYLTWPDGRTEGGYTTQIVEGQDLT